MVCIYTLFSVANVAILLPFLATNNSVVFGVFFGIWFVVFACCNMSRQF